MKETHRMFVLAATVVVALVVFTPDASAECEKKADGSVSCQAVRVAVDAPGVAVDVGPGVSVNVGRRNRPLVSVDIRRRPIVRRWPWRPIVRLRIRAR